MPDNSSNAAAQALSDLISSTLTLISQFRGSLSTSKAVARIENVPFPLQVLRDAAKLLKAHATKIGLLAVNKPFTPSALSKVIREILASCLPAMIGAIQACEQQKNRWTAMMAQESKAKVQILLLELTVMLNEVEAINQGKSGAGTRNSLNSTGILWQCCDAIIELERIGPAGIAVRKAEQYRDTIQDAIQELDEWRNGEGDPNTEGKDALLDSDDEAVDGDHDSIDDIFNAQNAMPNDRPDIERLLDEADAKLKKIMLVFVAVEKRRLKTFPAVSVDDGWESRIIRLDKLNQALKVLPDQVDELAAAFYSLETDSITAALGECVKLATRALEVAERNWDDTEDQFTAWSTKWKEVVT